MTTKTLFMCCVLSMTVYSQTQSLPDWVGNLRGLQYLYVVATLM
jgi:hypothetical protein